MYFGCFLYTNMKEDKLWKQDSHLINPFANKNSLGESMCRLVDESVINKDKIFQINCL